MRQSMPPARLPVPPTRPDVLRLAPPCRSTMRHRSTPHRREFLLAGGMGYFGLDLAATAAASPTPARRPTARSTIMIWLSGGASHIDTWDMKPDAPAEYRGTFKPIPT